MDVNMFYFTPDNFITSQLNPYRHFDLHKNTYL